mgnify:CR=1 FL=1
MVERVVLELLLATLVFADQAFVGLNGNKTNLVLQPPAGGQVVVDGVAFRSLMERLNQLETQVGTLPQQLDGDQCMTIADTTTITGLSGSGTVASGLAECWRATARFMASLIMQCQSSLLTRRPTPPTPPL